MGASAGPHRGPALHPTGAGRGAEDDASRRQVPGRSVARRCRWMGRGPNGPTTIQGAGGAEHQRSNRPPRPPRCRGKGGRARPPASVPRWPGMPLAAGRAGWHGQRARGRASGPYDKGPRWRASAHRAGATPQRAEPQPAPGGVPGPRRSGGGNLPEGCRLPPLGAAAVQRGPLGPLPIKAGPRQSGRLLRSRSGQKCIKVHPAALPIWGAAPAPDLPKAKSLAFRYALA